MEDSSVSKSEQSQHYYEPYSDSSVHDQHQPQFMAQPEEEQQEQDYQPPQQQQQPPEQPMQQQSQAQQYPTQPQTNQAYGAQTAAGPIQFPSTAPDLQPIPSQPEQFPPQNPNQPAVYPPQPAQFPPRNPTQAAAYPPRAPQSSQPPPVPFPPQPAAYPPQGPQNLPNPPVQFPPQSLQMNPTYPTGPNQPAAFPPPGPQPTSGTYQPQEKPGVYRPQGQAFTQAAYKFSQPQAVSVAPHGPAQGCHIPSSPYKPTAAQGIPVEMDHTLPQQIYSEQWKTGLFDCMEDPNNALITACFPCVTFGQIAEIVDNGQTACSNNGLFYGLISFCIAMPCIMSFGYRTKLRAKYGLVEAPGPDWAVHFLFEWCALCQEYRELQRRGFDPAIGWQGNVMRQNMQQQRVTMTPPMNQHMMP